MTAIPDSLNGTTTLTGCRKNISWQTWLIVFLALVLPTIITLGGMLYLEINAAKIVRLDQPRSQK